MIHLTPKNKNLLAVVVVMTVAFCLMAFVGGIMVGAKINHC